MGSTSFELLKRRALSFLRDARVDLDSGDYDLVLFHVEQFAQLYAKYLIYRKLGDFPKVHTLVKLLRDLARVYEDCELGKFISENLEALYLLEESYISSHYVPREYEREVALRAINLGEKLLEVFRCLENLS